MAGIRTVVIVMSEAEGPDGQLQGRIETQSNWQVAGQLVQCSDRAQTIKAIKAALDRYIMGTEIDAPMIVPPR